MFSEALEKARSLFLAISLGAIFVLPHQANAEEPLIHPVHSDLEIKQIVEEKISKTFDDDQVEVQVTVHNGDVFLDGWMAQGRLEFVLASIVNTVDGVRSLKNNAYVDSLRNKE